MGFIGRLFDPRDRWVRMILLDLSGLSYLIFGRPGTTLPPGQLVLAGVAFAGTLALARWPLPSLVVQVGLLSVALAVLDDPTINQVGAAWMLAEVILWSERRRSMVIGIGLLVGPYLVFRVPHAPSSWRDAVFGLLLPVWLPALIGGFLRANREIGRQARRRAEADRLRQESEARAARADERSAIARELHDVVAHQVASMVLRAGVARHVVGDLDPRVADVLDDVHGTGTTALADLRRLVGVLRDPARGAGDAALTAIDPGSLPTALGVAVDNARRGGLTVEADIDEAVGTIDAVRGLAVLRLTQEALTNVAKHAGNTARARVRIAVTEGDLSWEVADDGGTAPVPVPPGGGHGLAGMRERVTVLGGELTAGPTGTGWLVRTVLPATA